MSRASFANAAIRGLPPQSIRIDPETQAVITGDSMEGASGHFEAAELVGKVGLQIRMALEGNFLDNLVTVSSTTRTQREEQRLIQKLHDTGLALPA